MNSEYSDKCLTFLVVVGIGCVLKFAIRSLLSLWSCFRAYCLAPWGILRTNIKRHGDWAVITGASEGIGRGYALELARQGFNIVIMSRSEEKLRSVENEIRSQYDRDVRVIPVDFTQGQSVYDDIQAEISDLDIGILVNNVGLSGSNPDKLEYINLSEDHHRNMVEVNCQVMVQMTHLVLPKMAENQRGIIINLSSMVTLRVFPFSIVYTATKEFVKSFSAGLRREYQNRGIIVQCVFPGLVTTSMTRNVVKKPSVWSPDPVAYGRSAVATIGIQDNTTGYLRHALQGWIVSLLFDRLFYIIVSRFLAKAPKKQQ